MKHRDAPTRSSRARTPRRARPRTFSIVVFLAGLLIIGALRHAGHPGLIDRGEGQPRDWADTHTKYHVGGAAAVAFTVAVVDGALAGGAVSLSLWTAVELAQRFPREGDGYFEWPDMWWNAVGAAAGAILATLLRRVRRRSPSKA